MRQPPAQRPQCDQCPRIRPLQVLEPDHHRALERQRLEALDDLIDKPVLHPGNRNRPLRHLRDEPQRIGQHPKKPGRDRARPPAPRTRRTRPPRPPPKRLTPSASCRSRAHPQSTPSQPCRRTRGLATHRALTTRTLVQPETPSRPLRPRPQAYKSLRTWPMSRAPIGGKLTAEMRAPAQPVQLLVTFDPDSDPPGGSVRDHTGREQEFKGWLGLLRLLEIHHQHPARDTARCDRRGLHMATASNDTAPIALQPSQGESLWFLGLLVTIKASSETTAGAAAVIEHLGPRGSGSPLHVQQPRGRVVLRHGRRADLLGRRPGDRRAGRLVRLRAEASTHVQVSSEQARFLLGDRTGRLRENHARGLAEPAARLEIPPAPAPHRT